MRDYSRCHAPLYKYELVDQPDRIEYSEPNSEISDKLSILWCSKRLVSSRKMFPLWYDDYPGPSRNWISLWSPEEEFHPLRTVLNELAHLEKDNSITIDKDKFQANVDVQQFKPEEITVKLEGDNTVTVEGKHEEKQDEHGFISRHFIRRYKVPVGCDVQKLKSKLSSDGVLQISAPKMPDTKQIESKPIPISLTGPVRNAEQKQIQSEEKKA